MAHAKPRQIGMPAQPRAKAALFQRSRMHCLINGFDVAQLRRLKGRLRAIVRVRERDRSCRWIPAE